MKLVILAGGYGTRIRDVSEDIPKPMIKIGPYPIIWHIMYLFSKYGIKDFIICLGYKGNIIKDFFLNYKSYSSDFTIDLKTGESIFYSNNKKLDWKITFVDTGLNTMTGGRIARIKKYLDDEDFMITYGDGLSDVNIDNLINFHKSHNKILTVTGVRPPGRFGEMVSDNNIVTEFNETPQTSGGRINGGFFVSNLKLFDYLSMDENLVFEQDPLRKLVSDKELIMFKHDGFWQPMDTSREYVLLNNLYKENNIPWM